VEGNTDVVWLVVSVGRGRKEWRVNTMEFSWIRAGLTGDLVRRQSKIRPKVLGLQTDSSQVSCTERAINL